MDHASSVTNILSIKYERRFTAWHAGGLYFEHNNTVHDLDLQSNHLMQNKGNKSDSKNTD